jgi:hypothetical protein
MDIVWCLAHFKGKKRCLLLADAQRRRSNHIAIAVSKIISLSNVESKWHVSASSFPYPRSRTKEKIKIFISRAHLPSRARKSAKEFPAHHTNSKLQKAIKRDTPHTLSHWHTGQQLLHLNPSKLSAHSRPAPLPSSLSWPPPSNSTRTFPAI